MYQFYVPTKIHFGVGAVKTLATILDTYPLSTNILLVTDKGIIEAGLVNQIEDILLEKQFSYTIFSDVQPNPKSSMVNEGAQFAKNLDIQLIIAFGGGSTIDTAKAISILLTNDGTILDYEGVGKVQHDGIDVIAIPTTAGTGSEVTASTVITDEHTLFKAAIISPKIFPTYAIVDPQLTVGCPPTITSSTAVDALTHAIESYLSKQENGVVRQMALQAITLIHDAIETAYREPKNIQARTDVLEGAMLAGLCFSQTRLGNVHAISQAFGGIFDIPHGFANAVLLPYVLAFNLPAAPQKFVHIAQALGVYDGKLSDIENGQRVVERIQTLNATLHIPATTKELGVQLDALPQLIADSMRSGNVLVNPRQTTAEDIETIIKNSYYGVLSLENKIVE